MEDLELIDLLADGGELDRLAGDRLDGERGAAARVAVELRQDDAVERDPLLERLGDVDRLLTRHRIEDEEDVERLDGVADARELVHQRLVDVEPAGRVDDDDVEAVRLRALEPVHGGLDRDPASRCGRRGSDLLAELLELVDRGGPLQVGRDEPRLFPSRRRWSASFAEFVVLPEPWRPVIRITVGGRPNASCESPEPISSVSLSWTSLTTCWPGLRPLRMSSPSASAFTRGDEVPHDLEVDVGLEQREADLAHRLVDGVLVEPLGAAEVAEGRLEPVGEGVEHRRKCTDRPPEGAVTASSARRARGEPRTGSYTVMPSG